MPAVKYSGSFSDSSGYGSANRAFITTLYMAGVDLTTELAVQMKEKIDHAWEGELCYSLKDRAISYKIKIIHLTPDMYDSFMEKGKYHIGHLFWEVDRLPQGWADMCNKMNELWVSSPHMIKLFRDSGVKIPMFSFPQPIDISLADKNYRKYHIQGHNGFLFYSIFQWITRKNPKLLLQSFWEQFKDHDDCSLLLKTFRLNYDGSEFNKIRDNILSWKREMGQGIWPKVFLSTELLTQNEMMRIHATGDAFVLPHRGEGWCRPIEEALLMGKPVIATSRGGIHEYLPSDTYFGVESTYVPVEEVSYIKFYTADQKWAEANADDLKRNMKFVYDNQKLSTAKGLMGREYVRDNFNYFKVGAAMRKRLEDIERVL